MRHRIVLAVAALAFGVAVVASVVPKDAARAAGTTTTTTVSTTTWTTTSTAPQAGAIETDDASLPVFLQFFNWFNQPSWQENTFVDPIDWSAIGIHGKDRSSESFYYKQFAYIKSLGVDALAWEYNAQYGAPPSYPPPNAIAALRQSGLKIAPFYDLEISFSVANGETPQATLTNPDAIRPDRATADFMIDELSQFYAHVPADLLAHDRKGRSVIFMFGYGFDDSDPNPSEWTAFGQDLVDGVRAIDSGQPAFYWTATNSVFEDHLFLHDPTNFVPFQFVLDTPQPQYGHDSVTWNFGFDNLGVQKRSGLERVIRLDPRYVEEMGWLSKATDPALVFIYGWDEPFEDSMLIPTKRWGDTKARLAKLFIERLKYGKDPPLPKTLLIVDDTDQYWTSRAGDWHLSIEEDLLLYPMRRFVPQSDVMTVSEVTPAVLDQYHDIVDIASETPTRLALWLLDRMKTDNVLVVDPVATANGHELASYFARVGTSPTVDGNVPMSDGQTMFVRDDVNLLDARRGVKVLLSAKMPVPSGGTRSVPLVLKRGSDTFINAFDTDQAVLTSAFESFYNEPMHISIMYGEGMASQRLEIAPGTHTVTENHLAMYSIDGHWQIPSSIDWDRMPPDVSEKYFDFIFDKSG